MTTREERVMDRILYQLAESYISQGQYRKAFELRQMFLNRSNNINEKA